jgi:holo-[acyl-carrier protein] synthase
VKVLGIGVDLVEVARLEQSISRQGERFLRRVFTANEIAYCSAMKSPGPNYAARFAAKEAVAKAFGTGLGAQLSFQDIEVRRKAERRTLRGATRRGCEAGPPARRPADSAQPQPHRQLRRCSSRNQRH